MKNTICIVTSILWMLASLAAQDNISQAMAMNPSSDATGKLSGVRAIYLASAPKDDDTPEMAKARLIIRSDFGLAGYESILHTFRQRHDELAAQYSSQVAQNLAAGQVPDPVIFTAQLDALVYSTMDQIRVTPPAYLDPKRAAERQIQMTKCSTSPCPKVKYDLLPGVDLRPGQSLWSEDRAYKLTLERDGALILRGPSGPAWSSGSQGKAATYVEMRIDGNLVMYDASGTELWASGTLSPQSSLRVTNSGTVMIQDEFGRTIWNNGVLISPQPTVFAPPIRSISGLTEFLKLSVEMKHEDSSGMHSVAYQTLQISGIRTLGNDYCRENLMECAIVVITPQWDDHLESGDSLANVPHEAHPSGIFNYFNVEGISVLDPVGRNISAHRHIDFRFRADIVADPSDAGAQTGHGDNSSRLRAMVDQKQASVCFAVTYPPGAGVYVDGLKAGVTPLGFALTKHDVERVITVQMPGYRTVQKKIMPDGNTVPIGLTLEKASSQGQSR